MREIRRIPIVLDAIQNNYADFLKECGVTIIDIDVLKTLFKTDRKEIEEFWTKNPDLRLTQVLANFNKIPNLPGFWYYREEVDYVVEKGFVRFEDIHFWGVNFNKDGERLPQTEYKPLSELETDHIKGIIKFFEKERARGIADINQKYLEYFLGRIADEADN